LSLNTILATAPLTTSGFHLKATGTTIGNSLIWDNGTNVGIGNQGTTYTLDVSGTGRFKAPGNGYTNGSIVLTNSTAATSTYMTNTGGIFYLSNNGSTDHFQIASTGAATFSSTISAGVITGDSLSTGVPSIIAKVGGGGNNGTYGFGNNTDYKIRAGSDYGAMLFDTNGAERMRITSGGFIGFGVTPTRPVVASFSVVGSIMEVINTRNAGGSDYALVTSLGTNDANTSCYHNIASTGGADRMYVYGNGNIVNTNNSYGTLSDITLKENIVDATPKLDDILQLKVRNFNLIDDEFKTKQIGFIAQEFEEVFPKMIDIDGKSGKKLIKTSVLVPMLVKAIQEQQAQIQELSNRLIKLESK